MVGDAGTTPRWPRYAGEVSGWKLPARALTTRRVAGSAFVHAQDSERVAVLNGTALAVWDLAPGAAGPEELVERVAAEHARSPEDVRVDVLRTVDELVEAGLLVRR